MGGLLGILGVGRGRGSEGLRVWMAVFFFGQAFGNWLRRGDTLEFIRIT